MANTLQLDAPPTIPWAEWYGRQWLQTAQGQHILFSGPTQSGKTLACRYVTRLQQFAVVFGTKPKDPSLDAYVADGYTRIDHWPPTRKDLRNWSSEEVRLILWPDIKTRADLRGYKTVFQRCLEETFIDGRMCLVIDEGLWMTNPRGLGLGQEISDLAYGSASNQVSMHLLVQRPANVPPVTWTSCMQAIIFHSGRTDDVRELASLGTYEPREAAAAIKGLRGHQFLDLPCRGGAEWSISEVDLRVA